MYTHIYQVPGYTFLFSIPLPHRNLVALTNYVGNPDPSRTLIQQ